MMSLIAIETSDIVGSTSMSKDQLTLSMATLKQYLSDTQSEHNTITEFYRGDAFQIMYPNATSSLRNMLMLKLYMRSALDFPVNITQSLAIGPITVPVTSLHDRMDEVFIQSGRQLGHVNKSELGVIAQHLGESEDLSLAFLNRLLLGLSAKQAMVIYWYIHGDFPEHKKIAEKLNMSRQNINTHLLRGNADLVKRFVLYFENQIKGILL